MAVENAQALAESLINAAVAAYWAVEQGATTIEPGIPVIVNVPRSVALVIRGHIEAQRNPDALWVLRFCRICGCTDDYGCDGGCYWVEPDLCSACTQRVPVVLELAKVEVPHGR